MKTGRPKLSSGEKKGKITGVRLRDDERKILETAASRESKSLSEWMRQTLLAKASS